MKQNERILVYLVTGFLAIILVVAVFFGNDSKAASKERTGGTPVRNLEEIFNQQPIVDGVAGPAKAGGAGDGQGGQEQGGQEQGSGTDLSAKLGKSPLVAGTPAPVADQVRQLIGWSERDRDYRYVRARVGDGLSSLVQRWCGKVEPFLAMTGPLNEDLRVLREGQRVVVPWVDDEIVLAAYEASHPVTASTLDPNANTSPVVRQSGTAQTGGPSFQSPGTGGGATPDAAAAAPVGTKTYTVVSGDSLWGIASKLYGADKRLQYRMVKEMERLNPAARGGAKLKIEKLLVPAP